MTRGEELRILQILDGSANIIDSSGIIQENVGFVAGKPALYGYFVGLHLSNPVKFAQSTKLQFTHRGDSYGSAADLASNVITAGKHVGLAGAVVKSGDQNQIAQWVNADIPNTGGWTAKYYIVTRKVNNTDTIVGKMYRRYNSANKHLIIQWATDSVNYAPPTVDNPLVLDETADMTLPASVDTYFFEHFVLAQLS
jgi:hypothetical protein